VRIRNKLLVLTIILVTIYTIGLLSVITILVRTRFADIELQNAQDDLARIEHAVEYEKQSLAVIAKDYGFWDETYAFAKGQNPSYLQENLGDSVYENLGLCLFAVYDASGKKIDAIWFDKGMDGRPCSLCPDHISESPLLEELRNRGSAILFWGGIAVLAAASTITTSDQLSESAGVLFMGRKIDAEFVGEIKNRTGVPVQIVPGSLAGSASVSREGAVRTDIRISADAVSLSGFIEYSDSAASPVLLLRTQTPRVLLTQSLYFIRSVIILFSIIALFFIVAITLAFHNWISLPLSSIQNALDVFEGQVAEINGARSETPAFEPPVSLYRKRDELGQIADIIRQMHERVREAHDEVRKAKDNLEDLIHRRTEDLASVNTKLEMFKKVLENTSEAVIITDLNGNIVDMNDAMCVMTGYTREDLLGKNPRMFHSERHDSAFYESMWDSILHSCHWEGELWDRRKDGSLFPKWQTINTIFDERGEPVNYIGVSTDISVIKEAENKLNHLAYFDPLTNLPNRMLFADRLEHEIACAKRVKSVFGLLFIDLDRFKTVNDTMGHPIGDELLIKVAERLRELIRESDTLSRIGGDEFTLILKDLSREDNAGTIAASIVNKLSQRFEIGRADIYIGASVGISLFPKDGTDSETLIRKADAAMYLAKDAGKGVYRYSSGELDLANRSRLEIESKMHKALERGEFLLYYQPQNTIADATPGLPAGLVGVEALIRWSPEPEMLIPPGDFLPVAEETGFIAPLGDWVLLQACKDAKRWLDLGRAVQVSVNVSARQFDEGNLVERVASVLSSTGLPAALLKLEVTESGCMRNISLVTEVMRRIKAMGVSFAIDDFGTGYCSLQYLHQLPVDCLKVDQSFVRSMDDTHTVGDIVSAVISMAKAFGLSSIAEGVETFDQLEKLRARGCDNIQGYLVSRPLSYDDFMKFLFTV
jgi:diguanylate cyclase (GGDEF)-like protein/PAS domain S-box-containing protein